MMVAIVGLGYVGLANLMLYSSKYNVIGLDSNKEKVDCLNNHYFLEMDEKVAKCLEKNSSMWIATTKYMEVYRKCQYVIICLPTNYDEKTKRLSTEIIDTEVRRINNINREAVIVIKSTVPIGYCKRINNKYENSIISCPEFLREGRIYKDIFYPSRIVVGGQKDVIYKWLKMVYSCIKNKKQISTFIAEYDEVEATKLFSNVYLAMRVAYFNELDMYAESNDLNTRKIIQGVCADSRIGDYYNNPSFGYGGYCLPKDTKQLDAEFGAISHNLIGAINLSNEQRIKYIANIILELSAEVIGIYRLVMKSDSDNFRESAVFKLLKELSNKKEVILYEPLLKEKEYNGIKVISSFDEFSSKSDVIIANRLSKELDEVIEKVYSRDLFEYN